MNRLVVPGTCNLFVFVPSRTNISMGAAKDSEYIWVYFERFGVLLFAHGMGKQKKLTISFFDQCRYMRSNGFAFSIGATQNNKRVLLHKSNYFILVRGFEMRNVIHSPKVKGKTACWYYGILNSNIYVAGNCISWQLYLCHSLVRSEQKSAKLEDRK